MDITVKRYDERRQEKRYIIEQRGDPIGALTYNRRNDARWEWIFNIAKTGVASMHGGKADSYEQAIADFKREYLRELEMLGKPDTSATKEKYT